MPSAPIVTWARILPLLAAVTPRSRYLKNDRRPATSGAVAGVACASLSGGFTAEGCRIGVVASFIMEILLTSWYCRYDQSYGAFEGEVREGAEPPSELSPRGPCAGRRPGSSTN